MMAIWRRYFVPVVIFTAAAVVALWRSCFARECMVEGMCCSVRVAAVEERFSLLSVFWFQKYSLAFWRIYLVCRTCVTSRRNDLWPFCVGWSNGKYPFPFCFYAPPCRIPATPSAAPSRLFAIFHDETKNVTESYFCVLARFGVCVCNLYHRLCVRFRAGSALNFHFDTPKPFFTTFWLYLPFVQLWARPIPCGEAAYVCEILIKLRWNSSSTCVSHALQVNKSFHRADAHQHLHLCSYM